MFNVGTPELLVILLVALIVLGPDKLPSAARQVGRFVGEIRKMSSGFQDELRGAMQEPVSTIEGTRRSDPVPKAPAAGGLKPVSQVLDTSLPEPHAAAAADPSSDSPATAEAAAAETPGTEDVDHEHGGDDDEAAAAATSVTAPLPAPTADEPAAHEPGATGTIAVAAAVPADPAPRDPAPAGDDPAPDDAR